MSIAVKRNDAALLGRNGMRDCGMKVKVREGQVAIAIIVNDLVLLDKNGMRNYRMKEGER